MAKKTASTKTAIVPVEQIASRIFLMRGHRVMLDSDLARLYRVSTKRLNEQVKRNQRRFPRDFMFKLTPKEKAEVVANCDHLAALKFSPALPNAFTEHGAVMLASVLNSPVAVQASTRPSAPHLPFSLATRHSPLTTVFSPSPSVP
jgi:hypothetical protein